METGSARDRQKQRQTDKRRGRVVDRQRDRSRQTHWETNRRGRDKHKDKVVTDDRYRQIQGQTDIQKLVNQIHIQTGRKGQRIVCWQTSHPKSVNPRDVTGEGRKSWLFNIPATSWCPSTDLLGPVYVLLH